MNSESNTFCILPFVHLYAEPKGEMKPCCIAGGFDEPLNLKTMSIDEAFNSKQMKELRKDMLEGKRNKVCDVCYKREDTTNHSPRLDFNNNPLWIFPKVNEDYSVPSQFQHLDVRFSNLCNFKCRMCNHNFSSNWYEDYGKIREEHQLKDYPKILKVSDTIAHDLKVHLSDVKSIYFAGGEPLIMPEHFEVLKYLHDTMSIQEFQLSATEFFSARSLSIHYNTNLSVIKYDEQSLIDLWKGFYKVFLSISCDGIKEVGEYQRTGLNWKRFEQNLNTIKKYANPKNVQEPSTGLNYNFQYTTTIWNVYHIFDFINYMLDKEHITSSNHLDFYYAWGPAFSALNTLPKLEKNKITSFLENGSETNNLSEKTKREIKQIIDFTNSFDGSFEDEIYNKTKVLDEMNKTHWSVLKGVNFDSLISKK